MNKQERLDYIALGHTGKGWNTIISALNERLEALAPDYTILQIKEKFGGLRYYIAASHEDALYHIIAEAEELSLLTCEDCGTTDEVETKSNGGPFGWIKTFCPPCRTNYTNGRNQ